MDKKIIVITGKGGVGKTTSAAYLSLKMTLRGKNTKIISIDPLHSLKDAFQIYDDLSQGLRVNKLNIWKKFLKNDLMIKEIIPQGKYLLDIKEGLEKRLFTEYEYLAGKEIKNFINDKNDILIIDTDSLEGYQRLNNFLNTWHRDYKVKSVLNSIEVIPVTTLEKASINKLSKMLSDYGLYVNNIVLNKVKENDERLNKLLSDIDFYKSLQDKSIAGLLGLDYIKNFTNTNIIKLYEQPFEPLGLRLFFLDKPSKLFDENLVMPYSVKIKPKRIINVVGKGGQGKSTIACALAVRYAKIIKEKNLNKRIILASADARSSLGDILNVQIDSLPLEIKNKEEDFYQKIGDLPLYVLKPENPKLLLDEVPGYSSMRCMSLVAHSPKDSIIIIDHPPTGNVQKNFEQALPSLDLLEEIVEKIYLFYLNRMKSKEAKNTYNFLTDRKNFYEQALKKMKEEGQTIVVMQATKTALNETDKLISYLYELGLKDDYVVLNKFKGIPKIYGSSNELTNYLYDWDENQIPNDVRNYVIDIFTENNNRVIIPLFEKEPLGLDNLNKIGSYII